MFKHLLEEYLESTYRQAMELKDILAGAPYRDTAKSVFVFKGQGLFDFLSTRKFYYKNAHEVWLYLADLRAVNLARYVDGYTYKVFELPFNWREL
jgi:hypothetical protein